MVSNGILKQFGTVLETSISGRLNVSISVTESLLMNQRGGMQNVGSTLFEQGPPKFCNNILPIRLNLWRIRSVFDLFCEICDGKEESISHVFKECGWARKAWKALGMNDILEIGGGNSLDWLCNVIKVRGDSEAKLWVYGLWSIWWTRNDAIFNNKPINSLFTTNRATATLQEFDEVDKHVEKGNLNEDVQWQPAVGMVKINCDAATDEQVSRVRLGCVPRDEHGEFLRAVATSMSNCSEAETAELLAIKQTVMWDETRTARNYLVESDCRD